MKNIRLSFVLAVALVGGVFTAKAQTADEIIQKHIAAIGGLDNWKKVTSMKMVASANAQGMDIPIIITKVDKKAMKVEYTINGMTGYSIITTNDGWNFNPFMGQTKPEAITKEDLSQSQDELDLLGGLVDYQTKGNKVTYLGKDDVEGTECHKIKVAYKSGKEETIYIDAATYNKIKSVTKVKANGKEQEVTSNWGNYQKLPEGIYVSMSMDNGNGPITIKTVEVNKTFDDSYFKPTEVKGGDTKK